jgi:hypothetical protein
MPRGTSVYDEAKLQGRLWTPLTLRSAIGNEGLSVFLEAYDIESRTVTGGAGSEEWSALKNKSYRGYDFSAEAGGINFRYNEAYIEFTGGSDCMRALGTDPFPNIFPNNRGAVILTATFSSGVVIAKMEANYTGNSRLGLEGSNRVDWFNDTENSAFWGGGGWSSTALKVGGFQKNSTNLIVRLNGTQFDSVATTNAPVDTTTAVDMSIGGDPNGANNMVGTVSQWIVASQSDIMTVQRLEGYAAWALRYEGNYLRAPLVGSHPFVNRPPLLGT